MTKIYYGIKNGRMQKSTISVFVWLLIGLTNHEFIFLN
jgi:hypothetical protein